jgi:hypothetical protein
MADLTAELRARRDRMGVLSTPGLIARNFGLVLIDGIRALVSALSTQALAM